MFSALDAYAFKILLGLYGFLGVGNLPAEKNTDWIVTQDWIELENNTFKLELTSSVVPKKCQKNPNNYVVFPGINLSSNSIFFDEKLYISNNPLKNWKLSQVVYQPVIQCSYIKNVNIIRQEIISYVQHMSSIREYPKLKSPTFGFHFLFNDLFYVSALIGILFSVVNALLIIFSGDIQKFKYTLIQDICFLIVLFSFSPGKFFEISVVKTNEMFLSFLLVGVFTFGHISGLVSNKRIYYAIACATIIYILGIGNKNLVHIITLVFLLPILGWLLCIVYNFYLKIKNNFNNSILWVELILLALIPVLTFYELLLCSFSLNNFYYLPVIFSIVFVVNFLDIIRLISHQRTENLILNSLMLKQNLKINELVEFQDQYYKIIHDIKSPLTGINFLLSSYGSPALMQLKTRFNELLSRAEHYLVRNHPDWVGSGALKAQLLNLKLEFGQRLDINIIHLVEDYEPLIYLDMIDLKSLLAEVFDNAINAQVAGIDIRLEYSEKYLTMIFIHNRKHVNLPKIRRGSGRGLLYLQSKVVSWGGRLDINRDTFDLRIILQIKKN